MTLKQAFWPKVVRAALDLGDAYGGSKAGRGLKANVEYVSANPTGPLHVGHCRGAVFGDALANLLEAAGFAVTREYYINDAGAQVDVLASSALLRAREALGEKMARFRPASILAITSSRSVRHSLPSMARRSSPCRPRHS